ncbi:MAG TPA: ArsC/Spx/MgsR family protein [Chitinophagaceae bacterium]|nr:ArsC/Spx/MgsR family protein [Chitinophagaceae bacterium]
MKKIYYLSSCSTCQEIIKENKIDEINFELQDIKTNKITGEQLDEMKALAGSYEALFSRRAIKYKEMELKNKSLHEEDYRDLILQEYTFLKRPVIIIGKKIFVGSEKKNRDALHAAILSL